MTVYTPSEDTYFLRDYLRENIDLEDRKLLEIGAGNGEISVFAAENNAEVTATDINRQALQKIKSKADESGLEIETVESDLFSEINKEYDIIVFNPPYLPGEEGLGDEEIWRGGDTGVEVTERFLSQVERYLEDNGRFYIVASSLADHQSLIEDYGLEILDSEKLWFEKLFILGK
ncbi:MAG: HemK2/MTQ2 family protein methyltransferase [Candidatus Nanohaloarchaea archaeon]